MNTYKCLVLAPILEVTGRSPQRTKNAITILVKVRQVAIFLR